MVTRQPPTLRHVRFGGGVTRRTHHQDVTRPTLRHRHRRREAHHGEFSLHPGGAGEERGERADHPGQRLGGAVYRELAGPRPTESAVCGPRSAAVREVQETTPAILSPDQHQDAPADGQTTLTNGRSLGRAPDHRKALEDTASCESDQVGQVITAPHIQPRKTGNVSEASYETALEYHRVAPVLVAHRLRCIADRGAHGRAVVCAHVRV
jgi:hypothetical protein